MQNTTGLALRPGGVKPPKSPVEDVNNAKKEENVSASNMEINSCYHPLKIGLLS